MSVNDEAEFSVSPELFNRQGDGENPEFSPSDYIMNPALDPVRKLDKRVDTSILEYEEDDFVSDEADDFVEEFDVLIGTGAPVAEAPYQPFVNGQTNKDPFSDLDFR